MKKYYFYFILIIFLFSLSCKSNKGEEKNLTSQINTIVENDSLEIPMMSYSQKVNAQKSTTYTKYNLPIPIEIFKIIENSSDNFQLLNSVKNSTKYEETSIKSLNLGIYSTDLAYTVKFKNNEYFTNYFDVISKFSEELEISEAISTEIINRINFNKENPDSLKIIANDMYWEICKNLEASKQINIMPFVVVGGWLESVYILTQTNYDEKTLEEVKKEIILQDESLKNISKYLYEVMTESDAYYLNRDIQKLIFNLEELQEVYDKIIPTNEGTISKEQFNKIKVKIEEIRNKYI